MSNVLNGELKILLSASDAIYRLNEEKPAEAYITIIKIKSKIRDNAPAVKQTD